jgi:hypothetical protein
MGQEWLHLHLAHTAPVGRCRGVQVSLRKIREVLRLKHEVGLSNRAIARACRVSNRTVGDSRFAACETGRAGSSDVATARRGGRRRTVPAVVPGRRKSEDHRASAARVGGGASGVGAQRDDDEVLWQEYREKYPDGYGRNQFCEHYGRWNRARTTSMQMPTREAK